MSQLPHLETLYQEEVYALRPKVLVILSKKWNEVTAEEKSLLTKILKSVKLGLASVQIITEQAFDLSDLYAYSPAQIITFGSVLKSSSAQYEVLSMEGISIIQAEALDKLDELRKKSLWGALRQMFSL